MSFITELDVVNDCLRTMGEVKLNDLQEDHTYKNDAIDLLSKVRRDALSRKLWFNTSWLKLLPQATSKYIMIPTDVLKVDALSQCRLYRVAQRGRRLFDVGRNVYEFDAAVTVKAAIDIGFEDLPYEAQAFVRDDTVLRFQSDFDGDNTKYQKLAQQRNDSLVALNSEHIRQIKANPLYARTSLDLLRQRVFNYSGHPWSAHTTYPG